MSDEGGGRGGREGKKVGREGERESGELAGEVVGVGEEPGGREKGWSTIKYTAYLLIAN